MKRWMACALVMLLTVGTGEAEAQRRESARGLPGYLAPRVRALFDDPETMLYEGGATIRGREVVERNVAVLDGDLVLAGEARGDVVVINGNVRLDPFARVVGDVIVLGGEVLGARRNVEGQVIVHEERIRYERRDGRIRFQEAPRGLRGGRGPAPRSRISARVEGSYSRVEGLPIMFGPVVSSGGWNHVRVDAMAIWRSAGGFAFDTDELGYFLRGEQHVGERVQLIFGATAHSMIAPVERWGVTELESSLSTVMFRRDYRDYFEREGFSGFARLAVPAEGFEASVEYRHEDHRFVPVADPWTWRNRDRLWRPQPLVAQGEARTVRGNLRLDRRNDPRDPSDGWYVHLTATRGVGGSLEVPEHSTPTPSLPPFITVPARPVDTDFVDGFADVRRYLRVGPGSDLRLRGLVAGSLDGNPLPSQYQHALGGVGSLPAHPPFFGDCGARSTQYTVFVSDGTTTVAEPVFAGYGCDRIALFQAEFRSRFSFDFDFGDDDPDDWDWSPSMDLSPSWAVFFDAGRGWTLSDAGSPGYLGPDTAELMDAGVGFFLGDVGIYWAWPLEGHDGGANFFLRIDHRF